MTKPKTKTPAAPSKSRALRVPDLAPGTTVDRATCDLVVQGTAANASTSIAYTHDFGELSITDLVAALKDSGQAVSRGDLSGLESMLTAQAVALNATFTSLARRAQEADYMDKLERYLRLALKAQSQCRATVETLAEMKNPPVVFARQANITNGPQQVNNGIPSSTRAGAHPGEQPSLPNRLLEDHAYGGAQMDTRAAAAHGRTNQSLEAMGEVNRPKDC